MQHNKKMKTTSQTSKHKPNGKLQSRNQMAHTDNTTGTSTRPDGVGTLTPSKSVSQHSTTPQVDPPAPAPWRGIFFHGPEPEQDHRDGEEIPVWSVYLGDQDANAVSTVYRVFSFAKATALAVAMAHDRQLELINEATTA
jgi:hypothetical protein